MLDSSEIISIELDTERIDKNINEQITKHLENSPILNKKFYTMKDLSFLTGLSQSSIYKYMFPDSRLPKRRVGNKWIFKADETDEFLNIWNSELPDN